MPKFSIKKELINFLLFLIMWIYAAVKKTEVMDILEKLYKESVTFSKATQS